MKRKNLYTLIVFLCILNTSYSQEKWSLDACIDYALQHNLSFKNSNYDYTVQEENYKQSKLDFLPSISAGSSYGVGFGRSIDPNTNVYTDIRNFSNSYSLSASLSLFNGFRKWNSIFLQNFQKKASEQALLQKKQALTLAVLESFYQVLYAKEILKIADEQSDIADKNLKIITKKVQLGLKAKSDLYTANSTMASAKLAILKAENSLAAAKMKLAHAMNLPEKSIAVQEELTYNTGELTAQNNTRLNIENIASQMPIVKQQGFLVSVAKKQLAISRSSLMPSLGISAGYSTGFYESRTDMNGDIVPFKKQFNDNASQYISASLSIPIFSGFSRRHQIKLSKINILKAQNNLDDQKQQIEQQISETIQKNDALTLEKEFTKNDSKAKEQVFLIAQKKYENGLVTLYELSQAQKDFMQAKVDLLNVSIQLMSTHWLLNYYQQYTLQQP